MKKIFTLLLLSGFLSTAVAQQIYMDFESVKVASLGEWGGTMDSAAINPGVNSVNGSGVCGKYIRGTDMYDNFKIFPHTKLVDVTSYASSGAGAPKITMKVYTSAPAGTKIDLQLGAKSNTVYPQGVHSEYTATTTVQNAWELITFNFVKIPTGSAVAATDIDKIVVLFNPGTASTDTYYFDEPTGPEVTLIGLTEHNNEISFFRASPNPVSDLASVKLDIKSSGYVSLQLFDVLGRPVKNIINEKLVAGPHEYKISTNDLAAGTYILQLKKGDAIETTKLIITK